MRQRKSVAGDSKTESDATQKSTEVRSGRRKVFTHEQGTLKINKTASSVAKGTVVALHEEGMLKKLPNL